MDAIRDLSARSYDRPGRPDLVVVSQCLHASWILVDRMNKMDWIAL
jgi:hypothetical protein